MSLSDWGDIWLNEGFATYAEWLWAASHDGPSTAEQFQKEYDNAPDSLWSPAPAALEDPADLFGPQGYLRGQHDAGGIAAEGRIARLLRDLAALGTAA